jgi:hypothetical protein
VFDLICYLIAVVLAVMAGFNVPSRWNLLAFAVAFAVLPHLVGAFLDAGARF